jgi:hypothetical protein
VPVHAQLLLKESVQALRSMMNYMFGTFAPLFALLCCVTISTCSMPQDFIFCSDDLRLCLAARSLTCPGFNFVFTSILRQIPIFVDLSPSNHCSF